MFHLNRQSLSNTLNEWAHQPMFVAAIASLGLHGVLFAALPSFSSNVVDDDDQRTVPVVELGEGEVSRLPSFVELDTPPLPNLDDGYDLDLSAPLDGTGSDELEDLLGGLDSESSTPLPSPFGSRSTLPLPIPIPGPVFSPRPGTFPRRPAVPIPAPTPIPAPAPAPAAVPTPSTTTPVPGDTSDAPVAPDSDTQSDTQSQPANSPAPDPAPAASTASPEEARKTLEELLRYNGPATEGELNQQADAAYDRWQGFVNTRSDINFDTEGNILTLEADYPPFACLIQPSDITVLLGVFVDGNNQLLADPAPVYISRTWRQWFDDKALERVGDYAFENSAAGISSYLVTVTFPYSPEKCPAAPSNATPPPQNTGAAASAPEAATPSAEAPTPADPAAPAPAPESDTSPPPNTTPDPDAAS